MSANKGLVAKSLLTGDSDTWDLLAKRTGTVFDSLKWTGLFGEALRRVGIYDSKDVLRGGFCLWEERRFGFRVLRNPPFTPQIGPFYEPRATNPAARTNEQRAVVQATADYFGDSGAAVISLGLSLGIADCLPFYWDNWKVVPHYTYRLDLTKSESELFANMSMKQRNHINKARKDNLQIVDTTSTAEIAGLVSKTFERQDKMFPESTMRRILESYSPGDNSYCMLSLKDEVPIAGVFVVHDSSTSYNLMTGYNHHNSHHGAGALAMWHAILKAKSLGLKVFDFEGSMIPPIESYFRKFGGVLTPIFSVHKAWLPLEMGLKLLYRGLF